MCAELSFSLLTSLCFFCLFVFYPYLFFRKKSHAGEDQERFPKAADTHMLLIWVTPMLCGPRVLVVQTATPHWCIAPLSEHKCTAFPFVCYVALSALDYLGSSLHLFSHRNL